MKDERGQAIVEFALVVPLLLAVGRARGMAAIASGGLRAAEERIVPEARAQRAGEAAVEAAAQAVVDVYAARPAAAREIVLDMRVREAARAAAEELARENGGR